MPILCFHNKRRNENLIFFYDSMGTYLYFDKYAYKSDDGKCCVMNIDQFIYFIVTYMFRIDM